MGASLEPDQSDWPSSPPEGAGQHGSAKDRRRGWRRTRCPHAVVALKGVLRRSNAILPFAEWRRRLWHGGDSRFWPDDAVRSAPTSAGTLGSGCGTVPGGRSGGGETPRSRAMSSLGRIGRTGTSRLGIDRVPPSAAADRWAAVGSSRGRELTGSWRGWRRGQVGGYAEKEAKWTAFIAERPVRRARRTDDPTLHAGSLGRRPAILGSLIRRVPADWMSGALLAYNAAEIVRCLE